MHRSGTSLLSAALEGLGVEYGSELIAPAPDNPKGFWEDRTVVDLNERIYQALGVTSSTIGVDCTQIGAGARWRFQLQIARWLSSRLDGEGLLGLKDPRLPRLMGVWSPVLERLRVDYWLLIPLRNPLSVAASLAARDGFSIGKGLLLWYEHMMRVLQFAAGKRFMVVDYDRFLEQPDVALGEVAGWLGLVPDPAMLAKFHSQVFDPALRHAEYDVDALEDHPHSFPDLVRLYRRLIALSRGDGAALEPALSSVTERFDGRFADLWPLLRQCGQWDMELWATGQFCQQQELRVENRLHRETELTDWISTLEQTVRAEQAGRAEAEGWLRQVESNRQELLGWISALEQSLRAEQSGRAEAENWFRQAENSWQEQLDAAGRRNDGLQANLEQILTSRSWRLTAPLRRGFGWWARIRASSGSN